MGVQEDEEQGSKNDKRRGLALKSKVIEDFKLKKVVIMMMKKWQCMQEDLDGSSRRTNHGSRTRINLVKMR